MFHLTFTACAWLAIAFAAPSKDVTVVSAPTMAQGTNTINAANASNQENHQQANETGTELEADPTVKTTYTFSAYDPSWFQNPNCRSEIYQRVWLTVFADVVPLTAPVRDIIEYWEAFFALPADERPHDDPQATNLKWETRTLTSLNQS